MDIRNLDNSFITLKRAMDVTHVRNKVIAENLANSETPGYKAKKVDFKTAMFDAERGADLQIRRSNSGHLSPQRSAYNVKVDDSKNPSRADGNNVDQEMEIVNMSENSIIYNSAAETMGRRFKLIDFAIEEGGK